MGALTLPGLGLLHATVRRRAYWEVRYRDGKTIAEYHTGCCDQRAADGSRLHPTFDWTELPRKGLVSARLICPNGEVGVLGNDHGISDRLFQFKVAVAIAGVGQETLAHVLGLVVDTQGTARCLAWEPAHRDPLTCQTVAGRLVQFTDNVAAMAYQQIGALSYAAVGIKPD